MRDPKSPPLVSRRSPSNLRAQEHADDPAEEANATRVAELSRLVELEENARRFHERERGDEAAARHAARRDRLSKMVSELGGSAPRGGEVRSLLRGEDAEAISAELQAEWASLGIDPNDD
jgi:hypothetical protein